MNASFIYNQSPVKVDEVNKSTLWQ